MKSQRPKNLDLFTLQLPITAKTSIVHRITGVVMFLAIPLMLWAFQTSLASEQGFELVKGLISGVLVKIVVWGLLSALFYHIIAGIRHIVMDFGYGESLEGGILGAKLVIVISAIISILLGVWLW